MASHNLDYGRPRPRRWTRGRCSIMAVCAALVLVACILFMPSLNWSGAAWAEVTVQVTDAQTGKPLSHATLSFLNNSGLPSGHQGTTNAVGIGTVSVLVGAGGTRNLIYQSMGYAREDQVILVQIPGYVDKFVAPGSGRTIHVLGIGPSPKLHVNVSLTPQGGANTPTSSPR